MIDNLKDRIPLLVVNIFIHLAVIYDYWQGLWKTLPQYWSEQYMAALLLMLLLSIPFHLINSYKIRWRILALRMMIIFAIAIPFAKHPGNFGLLYALVTFEGFLYLRGGVAFGLGMICVLYSGWLAHLELRLWTFVSPKTTVNISALISTWSECILSGTAGYYLVRGERLRLREKQLLEELRLSNIDLAEANVSLQSTAAQAELTTMFKERNRIAREIHDSLAYTLTNLLAILNAFRVKLHDEGMRIPPEIDQARILAHDGIVDVRQVLKALRPREAEEYNGLGNIQRLTKVFGQATGIDVNLSYGDVPQFIGEGLEKVAYRIVQEGLTNAFRHGKATQVMIFFQLFKGGIELLIKDNGCGTAEPVGGFGLIGIRERLTELGGTVKISSQPGCGFALQVWLPLEKEETNNGILTNHHRG